MSIAESPPAPGSALPPSEFSSAHDDNGEPYSGGGDQRPHVCFVAPRAWPVLSGDGRIAIVGGAEVQQCILARLLGGAGYRVSMICLDYGQPPRVVVDGVTVLRAYCEDAGVPVLRFVVPRLCSIWRAMREADADIYYQRAAGMLTAVVAAFCRAHGRYSIYAGALDTDFLPGRQYIRYRRDRWLYERGLAAVDAVIVQNETQQRACLQHYGRQASLIPSYYELPADASPGAGEDVLWVAMLRPHKRPELFLELARCLPQRRFVMIGGSDNPDEPGYADSLRRAAAELPNVEFTGFLPQHEVEPYFDRARVVVNTSRFEGMPNVFLQAWARGVPTLAFIDIGARHAGQPVCSVVADAASAAAEIERLFVDEGHWQQVSVTCQRYFATACAGSSVLAQFKRVLDESGAAGRQAGWRSRNDTTESSRPPVRVPDTPA